MVLVKKEVQKMLQNLPDDCTYEDIQYHLYVIEKINKGMERARKGESLSHRDAKKRMEKWLSR